MEPEKSEYHEAWDLLIDLTTAMRAYAAWDRDRAAKAYEAGTWEAEYRPLRDAETAALTAMADYLASHLSHLPTSARV